DLDINRETERILERTEHHVFQGNLISLKGEAGGFAGLFPAIVFAFINLSRALLLSLIFKRPPAKIVIALIDIEGKLEPVREAHLDLLSEIKAGDRKST